MTAAAANAHSTLQPISAPDLDATVTLPGYSGHFQAYSNPLRNLIIRQIPSQGIPCVPVLTSVVFHSDMYSWFVMLSVAKHLNYNEIPRLGSE
jgi:hypothetical protein